MYAFDYKKPATLDEALELLKSNDEAKLLAGGMTLVPTMKQRLAAPSHLIDLGALTDLVGIEKDGGTIVIGAMTTHSAVAASDIVKSEIPALAALAGGIGHAQVRHRGTMGGSIANNDPAADYPAAVLGLNAKIRTDRRVIDADAFFTGMFDTALQEGEIITSISFPVPVRCGYQKFPNPASKYPMAAVFVADFGREVRVAVTGAASCVYRMSEMEKALSKNFAPESVKGIEIDYAEFNEDLHASAEYRGQLVSVMAERAVAAACG